MIIVPWGGTLIANVKILNRDIGFVREGQSVAIKLEAFPFTRYGTLPGKVESISSDALEDEKLGLVYTARIDLTKIGMKGRGSTMLISPGMEATADIQTGRRSILSYFVNPIEVISREAAREK